MDGMFNSTSFGLAPFGVVGEEDMQSEFLHQYAQARARVRVRANGARSRRRRDGSRTAVTDSNDIVWDAGELDALFALPRTMPPCDVRLPLFGCHAGKLVHVRELQGIDPGKLLLKGLYDDEGNSVGLAMLRHPDVNLWRLMEPNLHAVRLVDLPKVHPSELDRIIALLDEESRSELCAYELERTSITFGRC
jgi:hypothetical protein